MVSRWGPEQTATTPRIFLNVARDDLVRAAGSEDEGHWGEPTTGVGSD